MLVHTRIKSLLVVVVVLYCMAKQIKCPECGSTDIVEHNLPENELIGSHVYLEVTCENGHEFGLELEVATILQ